MKKTLIATTFLSIFGFALASCGSAGSYSTYEKKVKDHIVTDITEIKNGDKTFSVDYFTKTIFYPIEKTSEAEDAQEIRKSYELIYKKDDGYRLKEYTTYLETEQKILTSDILYDIKHKTEEEDTNETIYYINKYEYDLTDGLYFVTSEKDIFVEDTPVEEQVYGDLWKTLFIDTEESTSLVTTAKKTFYQEVLDYGDVNNITNENFRSMTTKLTSTKLSYNSFLEDGQHILELSLTNSDVFDANLGNIANLFNKNLYYISTATIDSKLGVQCEYDLKAVYASDSDSIFAHEVESLKAPADEFLKQEEVAE